MILGIDASYTRTALVWVDPIPIKVVHSYFLPRIPVGPRRHWRALAEVQKAFKGVKHTISLAVIEDHAYSSPSRKTVFKLARLSAIILLYLEDKDIPILEISPTKIRKVVAGKGDADKWTVAQELKRLYGITFDKDQGGDLIDAAACAVWAIKEGKV